ncbi:NotI family restriction endonuclease [Gemmata algarum]|nr:NotI family restriction endonuclease [Gemmata algarum]
MIHDQPPKLMIICTSRFLQDRTAFRDCLPLLTGHRAGNEVRIVSEVNIPGGRVDYFLVSVRDGVIEDFVGIEFQGLDTNGSVWPERQRFLHQCGVPVPPADIATRGSFGMNWKMSAKTILGQLHHKVATFDHLGKRFVLVLQDHLLDYLRGEYAFDHITGHNPADPMQFHVYEMVKAPTGYQIRIKQRFSTDVAGTARCLALKASMEVAMPDMLRAIARKMPQSTSLSDTAPLPVPEAPEAEEENES